MAKQVVKISLARKFRLLMGFAVLSIIAAALVVPWYFVELLSEQALEAPGAELTRLRLNEWLLEHVDKTRPPSWAKNPGLKEYLNSRKVSALYTTGRNLAGREGPTIVLISDDLKPSTPLDSSGRQALKAFLRNPGQDLAIIKTSEQPGQDIYKCFRAVRVKPACLACHGPAGNAPEKLPGRLAAIVSVGVPGAIATSPLAQLTKGAFIIGIALAGLLAFILFSIIIQRLVLRPVRHLRKVSDKVAEGNLSVRSTLRTGDELERLGESFNEMLVAINQQHDQLRAANRALDLKLSELAEANVTLYHANKVKSEFVASVSHELRTPLNSIIGFAELLAEADQPRIRRYGQNIGTSAKSLMGMINDLLDLARIEAGKADIRFDKVSLTDTCETLAALLKPLADQKQLALETDLPGDLPIINTDAGRLQQILYNLLSNAIKYTPPGGRVWVSAATAAGRRKSNGANEVAVSVADTGPGIGRADQEQVFEKFYQVDRSLTRESSGTGLGLAIAKELAGALGGRLTLKSSPGMGAVFTLILPVDAEALIAGTATDGGYE